MMNEQAKAMARAVLNDDLTAAMALTDWLNNESGASAKDEALYLYDNGEEYSDHSTEWIRCPADMPVEEAKKLILTHSRHTDASITIVVYRWEWGTEGKPTGLWERVVDNLPDEQDIRDPYDWTPKFDPSVLEWAVVNSPARTQATGDLLRRLNETVRVSREIGIYPIPKVEHERT